MVKRKRYFFSVVEEGISNPKYKDYRGGRIEVFDQKDKNSYACYEARFLIPGEFMDSFRKVWNFKESDEMPFIHWDYSKERKNMKLASAKGKIYKSTKKAKKHIEAL